MPVGAFQSEVVAGVTLWRCDIDGALVEVMGIQPVRDVDLIRHAYVRPQFRRRGTGSELLVQLRTLSRRRIVGGCYLAVRFYRGFELVPKERKTSFAEDLTGSIGTPDRGLGSPCQPAPRNIGGF